MTKIITITGDLGSGKSTVSAILCRELHYGYIYTGEIQRRIAARYGMTTTELNRYAETHPEIDGEIDATFKSLNDAENLVVDSRLAWFFIPDSFKVFLKTNLIVASERISGDTRRQSETYTSREDAARQIMIRKASENKRYAELYGADCTDVTGFNLVVDTSFITPEKAAALILAEYAAWLVAPPEKNAVWISPKNLYPTQPATQSAETCTGGSCGFDVCYPVEIVQDGTFDYIADGHKRVSRALRNGIELIPAVYRKTVPQPVSGKLFSEWEDFHAFNYLIRPKSEPEP